MKNYNVKLNKVFIDYLISQPETGMGYQKVDILLNSGKLYSDIMVLYCELALFDEDINSNDIKEIKIKIGTTKITNIMRYNLEELGQLLSEYIDKIQSQLVEKLTNQNNKEFKTNRGSYEIIKIEEIRLDKLYFEKEKIHHLFSQNGCKISGTIIVKAQAYTPNSDRNGFASHIFEITFDPTSIKFNFESETFSIEEDLNISFISLSERRFY